MKSVKRQIYLIALGLAVTCSYGNATEDSRIPILSAEEWYQLSLQPVKPNSPVPKFKPANPKYSDSIIDTVTNFTKGFFVSLFAPVVNDLVARGSDVISHVSKQSYSQTGTEIVRSVKDAATSNPLTIVGTVGQLTLGYAGNLEELSGLARALGYGSYALVSTANSVRFAQFFTSLAKSLNSSGKKLSHLDFATKLTLTGAALLTVATPAAAAMTQFVYDSPVQITTGVGPRALAATSDGGSVALYKTDVLSSDLFATLQHANGTITNAAIPVSQASFSGSSICVAGFKDGGFLAAYVDGTQLFTRTFGADGTPMGNAVNAITGTPTFVGGLACTPLADGNVGLVYGQTPPTAVMNAQAFFLNNTAVAPKFLVYTAPSFGNPTIAGYPTGSTSTAQVTFGRLNAGSYSINGIVVNYADSSVGSPNVLNQVPATMTGDPSSGTFLDNKGIATYTKQSGNDVAFRLTAAGTGAATGNEIFIPNSGGSSFGFPRVVGTSDGNALISYYNGTAGQYGVTSVDNSGTIIDQGMIPIVPGNTLNSLIETSSLVSVSPVVRTIHFQSGSNPGTWTQDVRIETITTAPTTTPAPTTTGPTTPPTTGVPTTMAPTTAPTNSTSAGTTLAYNPWVLGGVLGTTVLAADYLTEGFLTDLRDIFSSLRKSWSGEVKSHEEKSKI